MSNDRSLRLEVVLAAIDKVTAPFKKVNAEIGQTARALKDANARIKELNRSASEINAFKKLDRDVAITANTFKAAQARVAELKAQMTAAPVEAGLSWREFNKQRMAEYMRTEGGHAGAMKRMGEEWKKYKETAAPSAAAVSGKTAELARALQEATREADALKAKHATLITAQQKLFGQMQRGGIDTHNLSAEQKRLAASIDEATAASRQHSAALDVQKKKLQELRGIQAQYQKTIATRDKLAGAGTSMTVGGAAMGAPVINAIRQYSSFEDAMLGVQRQVQGIGEVGSASYKAIATEIKQLGRELPVPIIQLAEMYTAAARMEVPREGLRDFTRTVTMMATAFDAVPDEIAESMGRVAKNFKIPVTEIGRLADTINYLDDNAISKGSDIISVLNRTSGVAGSVAITDKAVAALASTLLTLGEREEPAGTAINAMIQKFAAAEKGTKDFRAAMGDLGLSLADIQRGMQQDAQGTLFRVIDAIQSLPAEKRTGIMVDLVGMEHSDTLAKLVTNTAEWRRQVELANSAAAQGSMQTEFLKRTQALSAGWERFKNSFFDVNTESGVALRSSLVGVMEGLGGILNRVSDWMRANPGLTAALVKTVAVSALLVTGLGALALAMAAVIGPFAVARYGMALFSSIGGGFLGTLLTLGKTALPLVGNAIMWVGRALLMNPIGLAVTAIGVAALLIYKYWEPIKAFFGTLWDGIKANFNSAVAWFASLPSRFAQFGTDMVRGLVNGITGAMGAAKDAVTNVGSNVIGWFKEKLGIRSPSRVFAELGGFTMQGLALGLQGASGGPLAAIARTAGNLATAATVGMAGIGPAAAGGFTIDNRPPLSAGAAGGAAGAGSATYNITINAAPGMDEQALARLVAAELDRRDRARAARGRSRLTDSE